MCGNVMYMTIIILCLLYGESSLGVSYLIDNTITLMSHITTTECEPKVLVGRTMLCKSTSLVSVTALIYGEVTLQTLGLHSVSAVFCRLFFTLTPVDALTSQWECNSSVSWP